MANISTRVRYDQEQLTVFDKSNKDANLLVLDKTVKESKNACYAAAGCRNAQSQDTRPIFEGYQLDWGHMAENETKLQNRDYELNDHKGRNNKDYTNDVGQVTPSCNIKESLAFEDSRFTNPVVDYREMYTADYAFNPYLFVSPQTVTAMNNRFMNPNRYGESSRYSSKNDRYNLTPKQFATAEKTVDYISLTQGLLPNKNSGVAAPPYL
jgi:hypothetical protein